ncbi:ABC-type Fe3+-siderophore transport system, permease component [Actinoalloteichus fjordicus]|uniref:ABC-type Fe3+-siderophore transport system, permease component n=1 Tax=Actinoalloteichus fjordicus TaxID=1612552 RepID=A0AAC9LB71_9PSEU|nr:ABC-type Fe3+-siderophore transport system, permease component [Actinoalloteichus fjordicus]
MHEGRRDVERGDRTRRSVVEASGATRAAAVTTLPPGGSVPGPVPGTGTVEPRSVANRSTDRAALDSGARTRSGPPAADESRQAGGGTAAAGQERGSAGDHVVGAGSASTGPADEDSTDPATVDPVGRPSVRRTLGLGAGLLGLGLVLLVAVLAGLAVGAKPIPFSVVLDAFTHDGFWTFDAADGDHLVVREMRLPRTLLGILAGVALGVAGALMQGVTRNPLADPGILGVNAGAAFFLVTAISVLGVTTLTGYVWFGFAGAAVSVVVIYGIAAMGREGATPLKLALAGAAMNAALLSLTTAVLITDSAAFDRFRFWQVGALAGRGMDVVVQALPFILAGLLLALVCGRVLNALSLGEDLARSLGRRVGRDRLLVLIAVVVLCGTATAAAGPIGFIGLAVPHVARLITGPDYRWILAYSALLAPILLLTADILGRVVANPGELQVGVVTAVLGAPLFIALIRRRRLLEL